MGRDETTDRPDGVDLEDPDLYLNRELSELAYQRRVLNEAVDDRNPLLQRVWFLSIITRNLDEFVMKRLGGLKQQIDAGVTERTVDGRTPREQWEATHEQLEPMIRTQAECYREMLRPALAEHGIEIVEYDELSESEQSRMDEHFETSIKPTLTPLSFDPAHPFPFISNRSLSLAVLTRQAGDEDPTFTRIKIPPNQSRLIDVADDGDRYVRIEEVVRRNLDALLPPSDILDTALFRLTRNAEVRRNEEVAEDLIDMIEDVLEQRRFASVVRMEIETGADPRILATLQEQLDLHELEIYEVDGPIDYRDFASLADLDRPEVSSQPWKPQSHPRLRTADQSFFAEGEDPGASKSIFADIDEGDILLHHPYHDFDETVQRFLSEAANDPDVLAVKAAIYRTASDSKVIQSLIEAADNGKQVAVMVELKARFDEQNNLEWVRELEENGIHVAYGTVGLKTHTKTALVVRSEEDGVNLYSHVGTGNYHSETAKGYVDLGLLTADRDIGQDLVTLFNSFTGPGLDKQFRKLLVAPVTMRREFTRYIRREAKYARAGHPARIVAKVNALEDADIVGELYKASIAGVDIDLIVRDICRLRPGLDGISDNIRVHSVVGRFLEHSRIFYFENGARAAAAGDIEVGPNRGTPEYYIGSADWMTRNLDKRVEAVTPVEDPVLRRQLKYNLDVILSDNKRRWIMNADGSYEQQTPGPKEEPIDTQEMLMEAAQRANGSDGRPVGQVSEFTADTDIFVQTSSVVRSKETEAPERVSTSHTADGETRQMTPLERHEDQWYYPDSEDYKFAMRTPDGERRYFKTEKGITDALERFYGSSDD